MTDEQGNIVLEEWADASERVVFSEKILSKVHPWSNHHPYLYDLKMEIISFNGTVLEIVPYRIGFCRIYLEKIRSVRLNGERLILNGVNRHEWNPDSGRTISMEDIEMGY